MQYVAQLWHKSHSETEPNMTCFQCVDEFNMVHQITQPKTYKKKGMIKGIPTMRHFENPSNTHSNDIDYY